MKHCFELKKDVFLHALNRYNLTMFIPGRIIKSLLISYYYQVIVALRSNRPLIK